jgi:FeS assembly SUF system protein
METQSPSLPKPAPSPDPQELRSRIVDVLHTVYDPEIPVDIWELGLVYELEADEEGHVRIVMTLTSPACPVAESLPPEVEQKVRGVPGVQHVDLELTWEPAWEPSRMSEAARLELGF